MSQLDTYKAHLEEVNNTLAGLDEKDPNLKSQIDKCIAQIKNLNSLIEKLQK